MKKQLIVLGVTVLMFGGVMNANATLMSTGLDGGVSTGYLSQGNYSGTFDITNELLADGGDYNTQYDITSAAISFYFTDDGDSAYGGTTYSQWVHQPNSIFFHRDVTTITSDAYEKAILSLDAQAVSGSTSYYSSTPIFQNTTFDHWYQANSRVRLFYYNRNFTKTQGYNGLFSLTMNLNQTSLLNLMDDGILDFNLGITGDLNFTSASLTFDINENPAPTPTPEPATMLLFGTGLEMTTEK